MCVIVKETAGYEDVISDVSKVELNYPFLSLYADELCHTFYIPELDYFTVER